MLLFHIFHLGHREWIKPEDSSHWVQIGKNSQFIPHPVYCPLPSNTMSCDTVLTAAVLWTKYIGFSQKTVLNLYRRIEPCNPTITWEMHERQHRGATFAGVEHTNFINGSLCHMQFPCLISGHLLINWNILSVSFCSRALILWVILLGTEHLEFTASSNFSKQL